MKYHVFITKKEILTALLFIVGLLMFFHGIHLAYKCHYALDLNTLEERELKEGVCVSGPIDTYVVKYFPENNKYLGMSHGYLNLLGKSYDFYTIPVGKRTYMCIMAHSKTLIDQLEAFEAGHGEAIYFEGEIIKPPIELNWKWYESIEGFRTEDLIGSFVIKETNFGRSKDIIYIGVLFIAMAVLRFFSAGGIKNFITEETEDENPALGEPTRHGDTKQRYYGDYELQAEQMQLNILEQRLHALKRNALLCIPLLLAGSYILYRVSLLFGIILIVISVKSIWRYVINSSNTMAKSLAEKCNLDSLSMQIEERRQKIAMLEEKG